MGLQQSKDELLYQQVSYGNVEGIKDLHRQGAGLGWVDREGRTPLILACMRPDGIPVVKTLIELGADVNAYRPGCHAGTPLHHAAKKGLEQTVNLLLSHGANPLRMNDDCQTPLDLARLKGHCNVVRTIESRICLFSGWLREMYGPSILEAFVKQWISRKVWAVVLPCYRRSHLSPLKFELVIYPELQQVVDGARDVRCRRRRRRRRRLERQVTRPRVIVALSKAAIEEPSFSQLDPTVVIFDKETRARYKFLSEQEGDKRQLIFFYNACRGLSQTTEPEELPVPASVLLAPTPESASEDVQLAIAISASVQSAMAEGLSVPEMQTASHSDDLYGLGNSEKTTQNGSDLSERPPCIRITSSWCGKPTDEAYNGWAATEPGASTSSQINQSQHEAFVTVTPAQLVCPVISAPSAPPINEETFPDGPIHYPSVDTDPVDLDLPHMESTTGISRQEENKDTSGSCVICLDAAVEGACVPCGHMAGCMSCLNEVKAKGWGCPVCRTKIDQVIKLFVV